MAKSDNIAKKDLEKIEFPLYELEPGEIRITEETFEIIFFKFRPRLVNFAWMLTGNKEQANDAVQENFLSFWKDKDRLSFQDEAKVKSYLYQGIRQKVINAHKKNTREINIREQYTDLADVVDDPSVNNEMIKADAIGRLREAVKTLPERYKSVMELFIEEKTTQEIAQALGIGNSSVRSNLTRAKAILRTKFSGDLGVTVTMITITFLHTKPYIG